MKMTYCVSLAAFLVVALLGGGTVIADPQNNTAFGTGAASQQRRFQQRLWERRAQEQRYRRVEHRHRT
jgi:hypothetical protein